MEYIYFHYLVAFQKGLVTPAPIDQFLLAKQNVLTQKQLQGALVFDQLNCSSCHTGPNFGGQMIQQLGVMMPWPNQKDTGCFSVTQNPQHKMFFRVSPLRNIVKTAPYFHDASSKKLWKAIRKMGYHELGQEIVLEDIIRMQNFFKSLTGTIPEKYIERPSIP